MESGVRSSTGRCTWRRQCHRGIRTRAGVFSAYSRTTFEPRHALVFDAPLDVILADDDVVQPDLVIVHRPQVSARGVEGASLVVVEILSPSHRLRSADQGQPLPRSWRRPLLDRRSGGTDA